MRRIRYPTLEELIEANRRVLKEIKGKKGDRHHVLSRYRLQHALRKAKWKHGDVYDKAAVLLRELVTGHAFASGVRRTAYAVTNSFLRMNNEHPRLIQDPKILTGVREGFYAQDEIKRWLKGDEIREFVRT